MESGQAVQEQVSKLKKYFADNQGVVIPIREVQENRLLELLMELWGLKSPPEQRKESFQVLGIMM